jgi:sugar O-acyltransferase (sialic acid O-acetyltransferase NeuD family)
MKKLVIIGASGHGKVIADIALLNGYDEIVFLDDNESIKTVGKYAVVGKTSDAIALLGDGYDFIVGIGNADIRQRIQASLGAAGCKVVTLIHPSASVAYDASIGVGTVIMAGAVVNPDTVIGKGCIVNTCASVDHDNTIGDYCHISVGAYTAGTVSIGDRCWLGIGAVVSNNITICTDCFIGAGTVVVKDIDEAGTYVGVPAGRIK